jgi:hypothetical protein
MKNLFYTLFAFILFGLIASSCHSKLSVTKRHYQKGYYISLNKGKTNPTKTRLEKHTTRSAKANNSMKKETLLAVAPEVKLPALQVLQQTNSAPEHQQLKHKALVKKAVIGGFMHEKQTFRKLPIESVKMAHSADDALSLFWVIILIVLLIWLLGLIVGGFGLGGLIHLLLLIALILLILWLLRVV